MLVVRLPLYMWLTQLFAEGIDYSILDAKNPEDLTEEEKVALLGRPCHGDNSRIMVRIRESKEFKVTILRHKMALADWCIGCRAPWTRWCRRRTTRWWWDPAPGWTSSLMPSPFKLVSVNQCMEYVIPTHLSLLNMCACFHFLGEITIKGKVYRNHTYWSETCFLGERGVCSKSKFPSLIFNLFFGHKILEP